MSLLYVKALHIIFVVTWFAGLFYIVRLFIYHTEALEKQEPEKTILAGHFKLASKRLWYGITWPSAILTTFFGSWLVYEMYGAQFLEQKWLVIKLSFVAGLIIYHFICHSLFNKLQNNEAKLTSPQLRMWNEAATVFLVAIVFIVVLKDAMALFKGLIGLFVFTALLIVAIKIYKNIREKK